MYTVLARPSSADVPTILIVEDDPLVRFALEERLRRDGYRVREAASSWCAAAHFALEGALHSGIDLVILDGNCPQDAFPFLDWIRARHPGAPIILMTANKTPEFEDRARARGIPLVVDKPFDMDAVSRIVGDVLTAAA